MISFAVRPDAMLPLRLGKGRVEYVPMSDTYTVVIKGLTPDEVREIGERMQNLGGFKSIEESANRAPEDPPLPAEFQRRLEID